MICEHCGAAFCPDTRSPTAELQVYCDAKCRRNAKRKRAGHSYGAQRRARAGRHLQRTGRCTRKIRYDDEASALEVLGRGGPGHTVRSAYRCPYCDGWHLTSWEPLKSAGLAQRLAPPPS